MFTIIELQTTERVKWMARQRISSKCFCLRLYYIIVNMVHAFYHSCHAFQVILPLEIETNGDFSE